MNTFYASFFLVLCSSNLIAQASHFESLGFALGSWSGTCSGFGNGTSIVKSEFKFVMNDTYTQVGNHSKFIPTAEIPEGESHEDWAMIRLIRIGIKLCTGNLIMEDMSTSSYSMISFHMIPESSLNTNPLKTLSEMVERG
jgi:hypothetical protein